MTAAAGRRLRLAVAAALFAGAIVLFWPVTGAEFLNFDDPEYVTANAAVREGLTLEGVKWAFSGFHVFNWHPLTLLSHMTDVELHGLRPWGHHLTSLVLHAANGALLFLLLHGFTGALWRSALVAALFAVHPVHVESVAWVAERKDVLSTFFWMLGLGAYLRHVRRPGDGWHLAVALALGAGLMAKPMLVTFPLVLLLLDFWPLGRAGAAGAAWPGLPALARSAMPLVREKLPLFALSIISGVATIVAQRAGGSLGTLEVYPLAVRFKNALISGVGYADKMLWPRDLSVVYPHPGAAVSSLAAAGAAALLCLAGVAAFRGARQRPAALTGWLWYLVTLVPVIGLVQVGKQAMADRYTYVPLTGLFLAAVWPAADDGKHRPNGRTTLAALALVVLAALAMATRAQLAVWKTDERLFTHALEVTGGNTTIHFNLGSALVARGRVDEALPHLSEAVRLDPGNARYHFKLGTALVAGGRLGEALPHLLEAVRLDPADARHHFNLANALMEGGRLDAALQSYRAALAVKPDYDEARTNLAAALVRAGRSQEAVDLLEEALRGDPRNERARYNLGVILKSMGRGPDAGPEGRAPEGRNP